MAVCGGLGCAWATAVGAEVSSELSGSILVFPKVIANGTRDTVIQIANTSNTLVRVHCFYVNAALTDPDLPEGPLNPRLWLEIDFDLLLTRQQPTHWVVSEGRQVNPLDTPCGYQGQCIGGANEGDPCTESNSCDSGTCSSIACNGAGFDPGRVPPVVPDFEGELKCVEVDVAGAPISGNHLKGEAMLVNPPDSGVRELQGRDVRFLPRDLSQYNALAILGTDNNGDGTLVLGGGQCTGSGSVCASDEDCGDSGACLLEYNACPHAWIVQHQPDGAPDQVVEAIRLGADGGEPLEGPASQVFTELTVVPCTENFETQIPTSVVLQFQTWDEFESQFSVSTTVTCWGNFFFNQLGSPILTFPFTPVLDAAGTLYMQTRIRPAEGSPSGVLMVAESFFIGKPELPSDIPQATVAAANLHLEGTRLRPDVITVPAEQLLP
jgi:hypothetical protein